jgi:hypothetical protein
MKQEIILRINPHLHIVGNKVISYETEVALIKESGVHEYAKYSRTTGKHIGKVASLLGKPVIRAKARGEFDRFDMGCVPDLRLPDAVSEDGSRKILAWMGTGYAQTDACAAAWATLKPIDRSRIIMVIDDVDSFKETISYHQGLINLGLAPELQC